MKYVKQIEIQTKIGEILIRKTSAVVKTLYSLKSASQNQMEKLFLPLWKGAAGQERGNDR